MNEPPVCKRCGDEYSLRDGMEVSKYCDPCAQERVVELEEGNLNLSDKDLSLVRMALTEAIEEAAAVAACHLPPDSTDDEPRDKRLRKLCAERAKNWIRIRRKLGGHVRSELSLTQEFGL